MSKLRRYLYLTGLALLLLYTLPVFAREPEPAQWVFFKVSGCYKCLQAEQVLDAARIDPSRIRLLTKDITEPANQELLAVFEDEFRVPESRRGAIPKLFAGRVCLIGPAINNANLQKLIAAPPDNDLVNQAWQHQGRTGWSSASLTWLTVLGAGLIDGINPCAIATLIFFLSFLFYIKSSRRQIIWIGISFISGTFAAYLLIGVGLLQLARIGAVTPLIARIIYPLFALLTLVFAGLSFYDYHQMKQQRFQKVQLQLPPRIKSWIHQLIRSRYFFSALPLYGFLTGFVVALLEFVCTGQVYMPTIVYLISRPDQRLGGLVYLIAYNLCFILPLLVTFLIVNLTLTAEPIQQFAARHLKLTKILLAVFFLLLAAYLAQQSWLVWR